MLDQSFHRFVRRYVRLLVDHVRMIWAGLHKRASVLLSCCHTMSDIRKNQLFVILPVNIHPKWFHILKAKSRSDVSLLGIRPLLNEFWTLEKLSMMILDFWLNTIIIKLPGKSFSKQSAFHQHESSGYRSLFVERSKSSHQFGVIQCKARLGHHTL